MFHIEYFTTPSRRSPVADFIADQDPKTRNKIYETLEYLSEFGFHLPTNYLRRMSGTGRLWELRIKYQSRQYRLLLASVGDKAIVILHAIIKKTPKTPNKDIETAEQRLRSYLQGEL